MSGWYCVSYGAISGIGPTPALALRRFWREIERRTFAGEQPSGYAYLPRRRQYSVQRRAENSQAGPT